MYKLITSLYIVLLPAAVLAQEHGHSHGAGGEAEHTYPILIVLSLLVAVGGAFILFGKKKK